MDSKGTTPQNTTTQQSFVMYEDNDFIVNMTCRIYDLRSVNKQTHP